MDYVFPVSIKAKIANPEMSLLFRWHHSPFVPPYGTTSPTHWDKQSHPLGQIVPSGGTKTQ